MEAEAFAALKAADISALFSVVNQVIPRHSLFPRKTPAQAAGYQRHYSAN